MLHNTGSYGPNDVPVNHSTPLNMSQIGGHLNMPHNINNLSKTSQQTVQTPSGHYNLPDYGGYNHPPINMSSQIGPIPSYQPFGLQHPYMTQNSSFVDAAWQNGMLPMNLNAQHDHNISMMNYHNNYDKRLSEPIDYKEPSIRKVPLNIPQLPSKHITENYSYNDPYKYSHHNVDLSIKPGHKLQMDTTRRKNIENTVRLIENILINSTKNKDDQDDINMDSKDDSMNEIPNMYNPKLRSTSEMSNNISKEEFASDVSNIYNMKNTSELSNYYNKPRHITETAKMYNIHAIPGITSNPYSIETKSIRESSNISLPESGNILRSKLTSTDYSNKIQPDISNYCNKIELSTSNYIDKVESDMSKSHTKGDSHVSNYHNKFEYDISNSPKKVCSGISNYQDKDESKTSTHSSSTSTSSDIHDTTPSSPNDTNLQDDAQLTSKSLIYDIKDVSQASLKQVSIENASDNTEMGIKEIVTPEFNISENKSNKIEYDDDDESSNNESTSDIETKILEVKIEKDDIDCKETMIDSKVVIKVEVTNLADADFLQPFLRDMNTVKRINADSKVVDGETSVEDAAVAIKNDTMDNKFYECPHCTLLFSHPKRFLIHAKWHSFGLTYEKRMELVRAREQRKQQKREAKIIERMKAKELMEASGKMFTCKDCDKVFSAKGSLKNHRQRVHPTRARDCKICKKTIIGWMAMRAHVATHTCSDNPSYQCADCPKRFKYSHSLAKHKDTHLEKTHACAECSKKFGSQALLKMHMKTHERMLRGTTYRCTYCGKGFYESYSLQVHERTHRNERPFLCDICNTSFGTNSSLKRHMKVSHSSSKPYECSVCHRSFSTERIRDRHETRLHSQPEDFKFPCKQCSCKYLKLKDLQKHVYKAHPKNKRRRKVKSETDSE